MSRVYAEEALIATEVMVANIDQTLDYSNNYGGWLELYNTSSRDISLDGLYISDDPSQPAKHRMPEYGVVKAKGYRVLYFGHHSSEGVYGPEAGKQVPFKLKTDGGTICLSWDGKLPFLTLAYPAAVPRCSYARKGNGEWGYNSQPTPEKANSSAFAAVRLEAPQVNYDSHLFTSAFVARVSIPHGAVLRYTTDGSTPTQTNGKTSTSGSFLISETTCLRLCFFADGYLPSPVVTRSYIERDKDFYLPVVSVTTNPQNLYDEKIGVYVKGTNGVVGRGVTEPSNINMDWERPVNFEYITADGRMVVNQETTFCIAGGWSRHFAPASFKIKSNKIYEGKNSLDYPFFPGKPYNKYRQIIVRNGGNNNKTVGGARTRDVITQHTLTSNGFYVDAQDFQPVHVFLNGAYIGMMNVREPTNRFHGVANYGYDDDAMDAFEYSGSYLQTAGTRDAFNRLLELSEHADQDEVYQQMRQLVDMDEFINFMAASCFTGNKDWIANSNNLKAYRSQPDGRFHFVFFDQDQAWTNTANVQIINGEKGNEILRLYDNLRRNSHFSQAFIDAYCMLDGSVFTAARCLGIGDSITLLVTDALKMEGRTARRTFDAIKETMCGTKARQARMKALSTSFGLADGRSVAFRGNLPQVALLLNGVPVPGNAFDGTLYGPVLLSASAPLGYVFVGWTDDSGKIISLDSSLQIDANEAGSFTAVFQAPSYSDLEQPRSIPEGLYPDNSAYPPLLINEISASNDAHVNEYAKHGDWIELYNPTSRAVSIEGLFMSDDPSFPMKYQVEAVDGVSTSVPANGHLLVWADAMEPRSQLHAPFRLANGPDGGAVVLQAADGSWQHTFAYPHHDSKETVDRFPDGGRQVYRMERPTIGRANYLTSYDTHLYDDAGHNNGSRVDEVAQDASIVSTRYYSLSGIPVSPDFHGICIRCVTLSNGRTVTGKVVR